MLDPTDLLKLLLPLIGGILLGYLLRSKAQLKLDKLTFVIIIALIFSLGFGIGSNNELLGSLPKVGLSSLVISLLAIFFSVFFVKMAKRMVKF